MDRIRLQDLDWIIVTDPVEKISMDMEVVDYVEQDGGQYILAIPAFDEDDEDEEEWEDEEDNDAYIFKLCEHEDAELWVTEEHTDLRFGVTTNMTDEEFQNIAEVFGSSEEYDLEVEEDNDADE